MKNISHVMVSDQSLPGETPKSQPINKTTVTALLKTCKDLRCQINQTYATSPQKDLYDALIQTELVYKSLQNVK